MARFTRLLAFIILMGNIWTTRSCADIVCHGLHHQILFAMAYITRYCDFFMHYHLLYHTLYKIVLIGTSLAALYLIYAKFKATYDQNQDTFHIEFLLIPATILGLIVNHKFTPIELWVQVLWAFSIYLESVAILPQLYMVSKTCEAKTITSHYLMALGSYRALYLMNWLWRYYFYGHYELIAIGGGIVQTVLYCDFFYLYITRVIWGRTLLQCDEV
ncbi:unnamed protein product [Oppiella nova]|uniref:ER lumen protein-retaining receptor n=1 Tax=Oppiella nova TaxID=334625 RepID=A0A7R9LMZ0_9ACAR|nr:unnamed protein product [Oppiella nova]CAG2164869.1 unnamed protein product [Oppiella nova]